MCDLRFCFGSDIDILSFWGLSCFLRKCFSRIEEIGDKVKLKNGLFGIVKYIGHLEDKEGFFYGLDVGAGRGKNDGSYQGRQ